MHGAHSIRPDRREQFEADFEHADFGVQQVDELHCTIQRRDIEWEDESIGRKCSETGSGA
jgi:hypothetical protein